MALGYQFKIKQDQKMVLSHAMQQSIKILQMSLYDLREYIYEEFAENPILEVCDDVQKEEEKKEDEYEKYLCDNFSDYSEFKENEYSKDEDTSPLNYIEKKKSLKEYLYEQLIEVNEKEEIIKICKYIIECLDSKGYLGISIDELRNELNTSKEKIDQALKVVQSLEPYGIGAQDVKECLLIQSKKLNLLDEKMRKMIENHLEDIAKNKYEIVSKELNISPREAQRYGDLIKKLEPKPSRGFYTGDEVNYVIPDAEIKQINNEFFILMNDNTIPRLTINNTYKKSLRSLDVETNKYVKEKIEGAMILIKSIEQRKNTLYKVLECLIKKQNDFFLKGRQALKPLTLKEVGEEINLHESTISRAIKDKYVLTSYGTIKIKDFFVSGLNSKDIANISIKNEIKRIIDNESKIKPLSDECISNILKEKNIKISRRTVTKYREELGIKSSNLRKRL